MSVILVIEDEPAIAGLIKIYLEQDGFQVVITGDGLTALETFEEHSRDIALVVLDLMLPGLDGRGVCRRLRERSDVPIIMVTALDDTRDTVAGLDLGADDYVTKPFDPAELTARVRAALRRQSSTLPYGEGSDDSITIGNLVIDIPGFQVMVDGNPVEFRAREFALLTLLARHQTQVLTRQQILEHVWGLEYDADSRTLDVHISRLRERLNQSGARVAIETVRTIGYRLKAR